MIVIVASCTLGTDPCNDVGMGTTVLLPWWGIVLIVLGALSLIAAFAGFLLRANRKRPWG